eukprot:CAMPEP_0201695236 /NCGR_PEP_ID=MMETSP0578-20130828/7261_1 /ASSEMBLY_ACC=CAM_ASM_000663 /TAXON_ID=267565 /ORGANISM="Skeletonema grethea, Strain CCMP 1804" /LENGTH=408 /DNA_ID=CAMNT_0048181053 /DNA_START=170 /DNA_END=1396 /DNA_ORIENTATION=-
MMKTAAHDGAKRASTMIIRRVCRQTQRRQLSNEKSSSQSSAMEQVDTANKTKSSPSESSSSTTAAAAKDMLVSKLTNFTTQATQLAKAKANSAVTNASDSIRASLHNTTVTAKAKSEQYAWEAHRSINKVTKEMEMKIKSKAMDTKDMMTNKAMDTKDKMTQSLQDATLSTKERIKDQFSKKLDEFKIPKTFFGGGSNRISSSNGVGGAQTIPKSVSAPSTSQPAVESTTLKEAIPTINNTNKNIPSSQSKLSKLSSLLPNKETIISSATTSVLTNTVSDTTSNLSTQLQATVHKTFKWLWWWGLAAVGVYGISTTLTQEGVKALKDLVGGSGSGEDKKSSSSLTLSGVTKGSSSGAIIEDGNSVVVESDYVNGGFEVIPEDNPSNSDDDKRANGGYFLSWLSSWRRG